MRDGGRRGDVNASDVLPVSQVDEVARRNSSSDVGTHLVTYVGVAVDYLLLIKVVFVMLNIEIDKVLLS
jgi:hypothetical protein